MAEVSKQDSNLTDVRFALESSIGVLPGTPTWILTDPNTEPDFGGEIETVARNPIAADRQYKKGAVVDVMAGVTLEQDFTLKNQPVLLQCFLFALLRQLVFGGASQITNVDGTGEDFEAASGLDAFAAGELVLAEQFDQDLGNNGLHEVASAAAGSLTTTSNLVDEASPPAAATVSRVGFACASGDLDVDVAGAFPAIVSGGGIDFTDYLEPGDLIYVGGDGAGNAFANAVNNGFKRVRAVAALRIDLDKSDDTMVTETGTGLTVHLFFADYLKNDQGTNLVRTTAQFERSLGAPDDASPSQIQSEYVRGCVGSEYALRMPPKSKMTSTMTFMALDHETRTGATGVKSGNRPALVDAEVLTTASDVKHFQLHAVSDTDEAPAPLFAFVRDFDMSINNNLQRLNALGVLGAFEINAGSFSVTGNFNGYFQNVAALDAVRANTSLTMLGAIVHGNSGFAFDMPLLTASNGRAVVEQDQSIMMPIAFRAHSGAEVLATLDHTVKFCFFRYLPTLAQTVP